jgi:hypothetical protein
VALPVIQGHLSGAAGNGYDEGWREGAAPAGPMHGRTPASDADLASFTEKVMCRFSVDQYLGCHSDPATISVIPRDAAKRIDRISIGGRRTSSIGGPGRCSDRRTGTLTEIGPRPVNKPHHTHPSPQPAHFVESERLVEALPLISKRGEWDHQARLATVHALLPIAASPLAPAS